MHRFASTVSIWKTLLAVAALWAAPRWEARTWSRLGVWFAHWQTHTRLLRSWTRCRVMIRCNGRLGNIG